MSDLLNGEKFCDKVDPMSSVSFEEPKFSRFICSRFPGDNSSWIIRITQVSINFWNQIEGLKLDEIHNFICGKTVTSFLIKRLSDDLKTENAAVAEIIEIQSTLKDVTMVPIETSKWIKIDSSTSKTSLILCACVLFETRGH